jgi:DNA polymerase III delta subunit
MIVFLYGKDSYRRLERKRFYAAQFEKKYGIPAETLDLAEEGGLARLEERARSQSLFETKKLIIVERLFELEPKKLLPVLAQFKEHKDRNLLLSEEKKPVKALAMLLAKPVVAEELEELEGVAWMKFVQGEAKRLKAKLDAGALAFLAEVYAGDSWGVVTELQKIAAASRGVTRKELEESGLEPEKNYFALVQTLRAPGAPQRLGALQALLAMQEPAAKVFNILAALWPQKTAEFAKYDQAIKFGRMDFEEALTDLVINV